MPVTGAMSAGDGATPEGQRTPALAVRERSRQSQDEPAHRDDYLDADLEQFESQRRDLRPRPGGAAGREAQLLQQHVGRGGKQHAQLIGEEARAAGAVERDVEQFFDPILDLTTLAVDALVDPLRLAREFVTTNRALSFGSRPSSRTTSALHTTRRSWLQVPAA